MTDTPRFVYFWSDNPPVGQGLLVHEVSSSHTTTHHSRQDSSGRVISSSQRPLPDNTQHPQQTNIHTSGGIRTHRLSRRAAADPRLRPRGHWDRRWYVLVRKIFSGELCCLACSVPQLDGMSVSAECRICVLLMSETYCEVLCGRAPDGIVSWDAYCVHVQAVKDFHMVLECKGTDISILRNLQTFFY